MKEHKYKRKRLVVLPFAVVAISVAPAIPLLWLLLLFVAFTSRRRNVKALFSLSCKNQGGLVLT